MSEHLTVTQLKQATHATQEWILDLASREPIESHAQAYSILRAVLHALRDRLTVEEAAHLASQFPMMVRGLYYEGWRPAMAPEDLETPEDFYRHVASCLAPPATPGGAPLPEATKAVFQLLADRVDPGQLRHVVAQLPEGIASLVPVPATSG